MKGNKIDFYKANLVNKAKLFIKKPSYLLFYFDRFRKYSNTGNFDAFIISYPKSGRTWLQKMMIEAVQLESNVTLDFLDVSLISDKVNVFPKLLSTHAGSSWEEIVLNYDEIKKDDYSKYQHGKIIYLYRDPRDILVSQFHHIHHRSGYPKFDKEYLIDNPNVGLLKIINYMNKWADLARKYEENIYPIAYYQLKANTQEHLTNIFKHLDFEIGEKNILKSIENSTISQMRKAENEDNKNPWMNSSSKNNPNAFHTRKGITGEYKKFFSEPQIERINSLIEQHLDPYYANFTHRNLINNHGKS